MKRTIIYIALIILSATGFTSCEDMFGDFLDKAPGADLTEEQVFSEWKKTQYYFNDIYNFLPGGLARINSSWLDAASDLAETSYSWGGVKSSLNLGNYYASGASPEVSDLWVQYYKVIRKVNIFLSKVDSVPLGSDDTQASRLSTVKAMKAEARFLRAYFYWELVLRYGPVPIITERLDPNDPNLNSIQRPASIEPCIAFITSEIDSVYPGLTADNLLKDEEKGKITQGIALAIKSRILLYMASPRYNTANDAAKWQAAMDAAKLFMATYGHESTLSTYTLLTDVVKTNAYQYVINTPAFQGNKEVIFWRNNAKGDWWLSESPVSFGGYGGLCPSQNLVDMYDMANGSSPFMEYDETGAPVYDSNGASAVNNASGYDEQSPYTNRDPRFYKTVLYNGATWWNESIDTYEGGKDKPVGNSDATPTGYYNRKYHNEAAHYRNGGTVYRNWIIFRYAEILLNYAEARNEVLSSPDADVYNTIQLLRSRVGITGNLLADRPGMSKSDMRNFIRRERTVELCFEEHRWWDVRRWNVAEKALARPIYGVKIIKNGSTFTYTRIKAQDRFFEPKMYLYPVPENEIWKTGMTNNPGW